MTATQAPTPGPLDDVSTRLLRSGDWIRFKNDLPVQVSSNDVTCGSPHWSFIGRPDADGWMPWSGGENPVPGRRVEVKIRWRNGVPSEWPVESDVMRWKHRRGLDEGGDIIAFRLAPTAPVEASGSEREHGPKCWGKTSISDEMMYCYCGSEDSPQLREAVLKGVGKINGDAWKDTTTEGEIVFVWNAEKPTPYAAGQYPRIGNEGWSASTSQYDFTPATANDVPAILALLSARPLAFGGQHSGGEVLDSGHGSVYDQLLTLIHDRDHALRGESSTDPNEIDETVREILRITTPARAEAQDEGPRSPDAPCNCFGDSGMQASTYHDTDDKERCDLCGGLVSNGPEAQDEGAAVTDAVSHHAKNDADPVVSMLRDVAERLDRPEPDLLGARVSVQAVRLAVSSRLLAHPSPTPAADADRVRIAVEALEAVAAIEPKPFEGGLDIAAIRACEECKRYEGHPVQHGICDTHRRPIWEREKHDNHEEKALGYRAKTIARDALAALKSTAAKEGGEL